MRPVWVIASVMSGMMIGGLFVAIIAWSGGKPSAQILVSGQGSVTTMPDRATITYELRGEGATPHEAVVQMRDRATSVDAAVAQFLQGQATRHATEFSVDDVRAKECTDSYGFRPHLSTGPCAVTGYLATQSVSIDIARIGDAATRRRWWAFLQTLAPIRR